MDEEPSSHLLVVSVRTLIQGGVVLAISVALWLVGIGFQKGAPALQEAGPFWTASATNARLAQSPPARSTRGGARETVSQHARTATPVPVIASPTARPQGVVLDETPAQAVVPVVDTPSESLSLPTRIPDRPEGGTQTPVSQVLAGGGDLTQEPVTETAGIVIFDVFVPFTPAPKPPAAAPQAPETAHRWVWPVRGEISQGYSSEHRAIDISTEHGAIVRAVDAGRVVYDRWEISGYGYLVIVDHGDGYLSYYGHLYGYYVKAGQEVARGEQIGELGTTGRSTGPHLHFEIRQDGFQRNPLDLLP